MSKFGGLGAGNVSGVFRMEIVSPETDDRIRDKNGKAAYIGLMSFDSEKARKFDVERNRIANKKIVNGRGEELADQDNLAQNIAKVAHLTVEWYLVDPVTKEAIDVPCTEENAAELYNEIDTHYIYRQAFGAASSLRNFTKRSSKTSSGSPSTSSDSVAG